MFKSNTMSEKIMAYVESFGDEAGFVAWIDNAKFKGMVVQSNSLEGVLKELLISLKVKIAYDYGIEISGLEKKLEELVHESRLQTGPGKQEINLTNLAFA